MTLWEEVKTNLLDLYNVTSDKTVEVARVSSRKYEKFGISRDVERQFSELGNLVFSSIQDGHGDEIKDDEKVIALVERIAALELELKAKDEEISNIRKEAHRPRQKAEEAGSDEDPTSETEDFSETDDAVETIITDPILQEGGEDSAILMDAGPDEDVSNRVETEDVAEEESAGDSPKNEG